MPLTMPSDFKPLMVVCSLFFQALIAPELGASAQHSEAVRQSYLPSDFSQFAPRSAFDLFRQIPGFSVNEGGEDRGFGQAEGWDQY